jgi:hypothetical protein
MESSLPSHWHWAASQTGVQDIDGEPRLDQYRVLPSPQSHTQPLLRAAQGRSVPAQVKAAPLRMEAVTGIGGGGILMLLGF